MAEQLKPADLLAALGVVAEAEADEHLAQRLQLLAGNITVHLAKCKRCRKARESAPRTGRLELVLDRAAVCSEGFRLIVALGRAASSGQRTTEVEDLEQRQQRLSRRMLH